MSTWIVIILALVAIVGLNLIVRFFWRNPTGRQVLASAGIMVLVFVVFGVVKFLQIKKAMAPHQMPPDAVTSAKATAENWPNTIRAVGSIAATQGGVLGAELAGTVTQVNFDSGSKVEQGAVLVQLDTSVEESNLAAARAMLDQARTNLKRAQELRTKNANSQADLDNAIASERNNTGLVDSLAANIARKRIIAPFSGKTGIRLVNVGQYLDAGTAVVPLFTVDPLYVNFSVPQQNLSKVGIGDTVQIKVDAYPGEEFEGKVTTINPQVDPATRNVDLQATIPNAQERLKPGMFAAVSIVLPENSDVVAIPGSSVVYAPYGDSVYVVEQMKGPDGAEYTGVRQQIVKVGQSRGDLIAISTGIKAGEEVVSSGGFKLHPNGAVVVNNVVQPENEINPHPADT